MNDLLRSKAFGRIFDNAFLDMNRRNDMLHKALGLSAGNEYLEGIRSMQEKIIGHSYPLANSIINMHKNQNTWQRQIGQMAYTLGLDNMSDKLGRIGTSSMTEAVLGLGAYSRAMDQWQSITKHINDLPLLGANQGLKSALGGIAYELSNHIVSNQYSELASQIKQLGEELVEAEALVYEENDLKPEKFNSVQTIILNAFERSKHLPNKARKLFQKLLYILGAFSSIYTPYNLIVGPSTKETVEQVIDEKNIVTSQDLQDFLSGFHTTILQELTVNGESVMIERDARVKLKPRVNSSIINCLPTGTKVNKLDTYHKWAYVSYESPIDSLVQHGWVLKKYLCNTSGSVESNSQ